MQKKHTAPFFDVYYIQTHRIPIYNRRSRGIAKFSTQYSLNYKSYFFFFLYKIDVSHVCVILTLLYLKNYIVSIREDATLLIFLCIILMETHLQQKKKQHLQYNRRYHKKKNVYNWLMYRLKSSQNTVYVISENMSRKYVYKSMVCRGRMCTTTDNTSRWKASKSDGTKPQDKSWPQKHRVNCAIKITRSSREPVAYGVAET